MSEVRIEDKVIKKIVGKAIPKPTNDQNTDDIIPARYLKEITFTNMGEYAYFDERFIDGQEVAEHPLNKYKGGNILIGGANYGCGSSREHAPQALHRYGINAIIAESFAEIFAGNCASLGVVGVMIPRNELKEMAKYIETNPETEVTIDLEEKIINYAEKKIPLNMIEGRRQAFLNGTWDAMAILQMNENGIKRVESDLDYLSLK
jgi:3-isopropylmalate/(R)-2-methylmalate dehydratase small subunit